MSELRVLVCGGRDYQDWITVNGALTAIKLTTGISAIIHGGAWGADALAAKWAAENGVEAVEFLADWKTYGRGAGPKRNQQMLDEGRPDVVLAFPGGKGTADMVRRAEAIAKKVVTFKARAALSARSLEVE